MSYLAMLGSSIGGLGLFILGMSLMSEGLKSVAGSTLNKLLHRWTRTPIKGITTGFGLTALMQSSSAVTVTVIGFANAGLLSLKRAIWIIFGSNIGTTTTAWLVTLIGFNIKVSAFALPLIGIGMVLKLTQKSNKLAYLGQTLVGFGILFLGIAVLKDTFSELGQHISFVDSETDSLPQIIIYMGLGFLMTVLMQSSSVTLALTLTALSGGIISLIPAAAIVIGGNLGTTTTAIFASIGTNSAAKRIVASHIIFNVLGALITLLFLSPLLTLIQSSQMVFNSYDATLTLSLFHTVFNVLAVILVWPIANTLIKFLSARFIDKVENKAKPIYLNKQSLNLPSLALHGISKELERTGYFALAMAKESINSDSTPVNNIDLKALVVAKLVTEIGHYTSKLYQQNLDIEISDKLPILIRVSQYYGAIAELSVMINKEKQNIETVIEHSIQKQLSQFYNNSYQLLSRSSLPIDSHEIKDLNKQLAELETEYQGLKSLLLRRGAEGGLSIAKMDRTMTIMSYIRKIDQQAVKAYQHFNSLGLNQTEMSNNE